MISMMNWRLDIPSGDRLIGETGENLASVISISTDAGPDWTYWLYMCYADHTSMALPLSWEDGTLRGKLTSPYLPMAGPVMVTIQGQKEAVISKSNVGLLYIGRAVGNSGPPPLDPTLDHRVLSHRDAEDQHPIEAISGLEEISNRRVLEIWNGGMSL